MLKLVLAQCPDSARKEHHLPDGWLAFLHKFFVFLGRADHLLDKAAHLVYGLLFGDLQRLPSFEMIQGRKEPLLQRLLSFDQSSISPCLLLPRLQPCKPGNHSLPKLSFSLSHYIGRGSCLLDLRGHKFDPSRAHGRCHRLSSLRPLGFCAGIVGKELIKQVCMVVPLRARSVALCWSGTCRRLTKTKAVLWHAEDLFFLLCTDQLALGAFILLLLLVFLTLLHLRVDRWGCGGSVGFLVADSIIWRVVHCFAITTIMMALLCSVLSWCILMTFLRSCFRWCIVSTFHPSLSSSCIVLTLRRSLGNLFGQLLVLICHWDFCRSLTGKPGLFLLHANLQPQLSCRLCTTVGTCSELDLQVPGYLPI
mmetsp:Transcript_70176/g.168198  ORF Transcript_70176/g.168198 Transcript_70176/m.168198 type:complete len:365 (-) Transcript_70176:62-1156(-)